MLLAQLSVPIPVLELFPYSLRVKKENTNKSKRFLTFFKEFPPLSAITVLGGNDNEQ